MLIFMALEYCILSLSHSPPEPPVSARSDPPLLYCLWRHQFWRSRIILSANFCKGKRPFKPYQNKHDSVKEARKKNPKKEMYSWHELPMKILFTTLPHFPPSNSSILKVFPKSFPIEIKHSYCPAKEKKEGQKRKKNRGGEKGKLCFLHMPHLRKLLFTNRNNRQRSARPINKV